MNLIQRTAATSVAATLLFGTSFGASAVAQNNQPPADFLQLLQRVAGQYMVMISRSFIDLTYEGIQIEPNTNNLVLSGVALRPELEWDQEGACQIDIDRAFLGGVQGFDIVQSVIEFTGVELHPACLPPDVSGMLAAFGYDALAADTMVIDINYELPSAAADITIQAAIRDAGDLTLSGSFDYLWFRLPLDGSDEPIPVAILGSAELAFENGGVWERVEPMVMSQIGDPAAVPPMLEAMIGQTLSEGGTRTPSAEETAFASNVASEVERFLREKNRLVISVAPEGGLRLSEDAFGSPAEVIATLKPKISATPLAFEAMIEAPMLTNALGGTVADEDRLSVGMALVTGLGAPLAPVEGRALLTPLADAWNGEAAAALADSYEATEPARSYAMVLRALAADQAGSAGIADRLEANMPLADILTAQAQAFGTWPGAADHGAASTAALQSGDVTAMRRMAMAALTGKGMPRSYRTAYYWASLSAAAGDRGGAGLRKRLDYRFAGEVAWQAVSESVASEVLQAWTSGGVAGAVAERMR